MQHPRWYPRIHLPLLHNSQTVEGFPLQTLDGGALNATEKSGCRTWHWSVHLKELFLMGTPLTKHLLSKPTVSVGETSRNGDKFITLKL